MSFFDEVFWQGLVTTLVGVFGGAYIALRLDRGRGREGLVKKERETLRLVRGALDRDEVTLRKIGDHLEASEVPSQRVFPSHYAQALYTGGIDVFRHPKMWGQVANIPPALDHLNRRLDDLAAIELNLLTGRLIEDAQKQRLRANKVYITEGLKRVVVYVRGFFDELRASLADSKALGKPSG